MRKIFIASLAACPLVHWALFGLLAKAVSTHIAVRYGARILAAGNGKFVNAQRFVYLRIEDFAILVTAASLLTLACLAAGALWRRFFSERMQWILQSLFAFAALNIFVVIAGHTVLFWCLLFSGTGQTHNYTQYRIKQELMTETAAPSQAVLLGSSQTRAQIDEGILNSHLGSTLWTTELHFPGDHPYDMILSLKRLPAVKLDYVICYLSEQYFYTGADSDGIMFFFGFEDLAEYRRLRPGPGGLGDKSFLGLLGDAVPLFKYREPIADRLFGFRTANIGQEKYDQALTASLADRAKIAASHFHLGPDSDFQKRAFLEFARQCREKGCRLVVCCGQLNPILENALDPAFRRDLLGFLHDCAARDTNIVLLDEHRLPPQTEADYDDLTHANAAAQARFSEYIAGVLGTLAQQNHPLVEARK